MSHASILRGVYTMPAGVPFLPTLARGLRAALGDQLSNALILLPTRRAVRELGDALVEAQRADGKSASLLPRMRPLADIDPEEPPFEPGELGLHVRPAINATQRRFELAKLVKAYHDATSDVPLDAAGVLALIDPLLSIMDDADMEEVADAQLAKLEEIEAFASAHFQNAATFYKILRDYWPARLNELNLMAPMARRVALLNALTDIWIETPPDYPVIIAGSTGTLKATARLMHCVSSQKQGVIVLPGLDQNISDDAVWNQITDEHPQNSLKRLIDRFDLKRGAVPVWPAAVDHAESVRARTRLISESLIPANATDDWPGRIANIKSGEIGSFFTRATDGLSLITAKTQDEEADVIAVIMRETLTLPNATCALVTPDPALARRVRAALRRWNVEVDYSQGEPLEETPLGVFLSLILRLAEDPQNPVTLAALCKHPLLALGIDSATIRRSWADLEYRYFRGQRPSEATLSHEDIQTLLRPLHGAFAPLTSVSSASVQNWAKMLAQLAEDVASASDLSGAERLWREDAGEKAAKLLEDLMAYGESFEPCSLTEFAALFARLMRGKVVRPRYGTHPRLQILGPLEARMLTADRIILGSLNEGVWPATPGKAPFLSRGMRRALGLSLPERRYGLAAHDFAELAAHPDLVLTRSERSDEGPMVASRWVWRLQTLIKGATGTTDALTSEKDYLGWARALDFVSPENVTPASEPLPAPPIDDRWPYGRKLSITRIKTWIRDPYSIYAREVLGLRALDGLDMAREGRVYGNAIHKGIETYTKARYASVHSAPSLLQHLEDAFKDHGYPPQDIAKERGRLVRLAENFTAWTSARHQTGWQMAGVEVTGKVIFSDINFTLTGTADLIEKCASGYAVIDYKTGTVPSVKVVASGFDPQLPLTGLMLGRGGFNKIPAGETLEALYIKPNERNSKKWMTALITGRNQDKTFADMQADAAETLTELIRAFDDPDTPYPSQPRAQFTHDYSDYNHLARREEWARLGVGEGET